MLPDSAPHGGLLVEDELLRVDVVEVPLEALALQPLLDGLALGDVAYVLDDGGVAIKVLQVEFDC